MALSAMEWTSALVTQSGYFNIEMQARQPMEMSGSPYSGNMTKIAIDLCRLMSRALSAPAGQSDRAMSTVWCGSRPATAAGLWPMPIWAFDDFYGRTNQVGRGYSGRFGPRPFTGIVDVTVISSSAAISNGRLAQVYRLTRGLQGPLSWLRTA